MRTYMVIPTYWTGPKGAWDEGDKVFDHPTPIDEYGTLGRTLKSLKILENKDFTLIILGVVTNPRYEDDMRRRLTEIISSIKIPVDTILITEKEVTAIREIMCKGFDDAGILSLKNYSSIRNMCLFFPYLLGADIAVLIDDDEIFEDPRFMNKATEFIGRRFYGNTIDGVAGYYLNEDNEYYDKVNIAPWMTYWDRFGDKREAFDKIIGSDPRLKKTPFAFGGAMIIHRNLFRIVPFDPNITRGEDTDYVLNARIFGFNFYLDNTLAIKHLPPPKKHTIWKRFREDIYRFLYDKSKFDNQEETTNLHKVMPEDFDPYPGEFLKPDLGDKIFKTNIILALNYLTDGDVEACKETIRNIYLARYDAIPHYNTYKKYLAFQKEWRALLERTKDFAKDELMGILNRCIIVKHDKYQMEKTKFLKKSGIAQNLQFRKIELFKTFNKAQLRKLFYVSDVVTMKKDSYVFKSGETDGNIYIIISGAMEILKQERTSQKLMQVALLQQGEHFNESAIFFDTPHTVTIRAITDVELFRIDKTKALELMKEDCDFAAKLLWRISSKLSERLSLTTSRFSESQEQASDISDDMQ